MLPATPVRAQNSVFEQVGQEVNALFERTRPAIIKVKAMAEQEDETTGGTRSVFYEATGFFIDGEGTLLTTYSVLRNYQAVWVEIDGQKVDAILIGADPRSGVAMLKVPLKTASLELSSSDKLSIGNSVVSIGFPYNLPSSPSFGFIAGFDTQYRDSFFITTHIRANLQISPGQAGSPLMTPTGKVIGMLVAGMDDGKVCYALPVNAIKKIRDDMIQNKGQARHAWVGVGVVKSETGDIKNHVVRVHKIYEGTPAEKSDLKEGDLLLKIGDREIFQPSDVLDASFYARVGQPLKVKVLRDGKEVDVAFTLTARPNTSPVIEKVPTLVPDRSNLMQVTQPR